MLTFEHVTKQYAGVTALDDLSLVVRPGEVLAVVGSNGAGKTTMIKCALGLVHCDGEVRLNEIDVRRHGKEARRVVGYLPQNPALHGDLTVRETAEFYGQLRRLPANRSYEVVDEVGLLEQSAKAVAALSGGMRQRLALAIALLGEPSVLILDEPASSLDVQARLDLRHLLQTQRAAGRTIVLSTHWLEDVPFVADRVLVLDHGKVVYLGDAATFGAAGSVGGKLYLRLNGQRGDAAALIRSTMAVDAVDQSGDWLVVSCPAGEKARVLETLITAKIPVLDMRVEEASVEGVIKRLRGAGEEEMR